jgi:hypothetical protein
MRDVDYLYGFVAVMLLNMAATFVYIVGMDQLRASVRRAYRSFTQKAR